MTHIYLALTGPEGLVVTASSCSWWRFAPSRFALPFKPERCWHKQRHHQTSSINIVAITTSMFANANDNHRNHHLKVVNNALSAANSFLVFKGTPASISAANAGPLTAILFNRVLSLFDFPLS